MNRLCAGDEEVGPLVLDHGERLVDGVRRRQNGKVEAEQDLFDRVARHRKAMHDNSSLLRKTLHEKAAFFEIFTGREAAVLTVLESYFNV
jgi:hypothetical protein